MAEELAKAEKADLFEITPTAPYTAEDLDWRNQQSGSTLEMKDPTCRPAVSGWVENMAQYDVVFVGFPVWWGVNRVWSIPFSTPMTSSAKKIVPFCTSGGSGIGETAKRIREIVGAGAQVEAGTWLGGTVSVGDLKPWIAGLRV